MIEDSKNPFDYLDAEIAGANEMIRGAGDELNKKILEKNENEAIVLAPFLASGGSLHKGVWLGLFDMLEIETGGVEYLGDYKFRIYW
jgi:hypothetical protein